MYPAQPLPTHASLNLAETEVVPVVLHNHCRKVLASKTMAVGLAALHNHRKVLASRTRAVGLAVLRNRCSELLSKTMEEGRQVPRNRLTGQRFSERAEGPTGKRNRSYFALLKGKNYSMLAGAVGAVSASWPARSSRLCFRNT